MMGLLYAFVHGRRAIHVGRTLRPLPPPFAAGRALVRSARRGTMMVEAIPANALTAAAE